MTELHSIKSHIKENMQNIKAHTNLLYIFVMNQADLTSITSVNTAVSTLVVATSSSSQESVNYTNSLILEQLMAVINVN
jgi:hypothetical protein